MLRRLSLALVPVLIASPLEAQAPGYKQIDTRQIFAEYHAEVLTNLNALMDGWSTSWSTDDPERLTDTYWENAVLIPPGEPKTPLRGQEALHSYFKDVMPDYGEVEAFMLDFDASGGMAVVYGNYLVQLAGGGQLTGPLVTVYLLRGRTWKIRSQVFTGG